MHYYNTRDVEDGRAPEVRMNFIHDELEDLGLSWEERAASVAFLRALSDGCALPSP